MSKPSENVPVPVALIICALCSGAIGLLVYAVLLEIAGQETVALIGGAVVAGAIFALFLRWLRRRS